MACGFSMFRRSNQIDGTLANINADPTFYRELVNQRIPNISCPMILNRPTNCCCGCLSACCSREHRCSVANRQPTKRPLHQPPCRQPNEAQAAQLRQSPHPNQSGFRCRFKVGIVIARTSIRSGPAKIACFFNADDLTIDYPQRRV